MLYVLMYFAASAIILIIGANGHRRGWDTAQESWNADELLQTNPRDALYHAYKCCTQRFQEVGSTLILTIYFN